MANTNFPPQSSKVRRVKEFGEDVIQLSLYTDISHVNISLLNVISKEVVSPLKVSHSFMEDWVLAIEMSLVLLHMRGTLSKITPKFLMVCTIHRIWEEQQHTQPLWWIEQLKIIFEKTSK
jgi:hypothetical protein